MSRGLYLALVAGLAALVAVAAMLLLGRDAFQGSSGSTELRGSGGAARQVRTLPAFHADELNASNTVAVITASGSARRLDVALGGSGDAQLGRLVAGDVRDVIGGSGRAEVTATNTLDATVTGAGAITYGGSPAHVTKTVTGIGAISAR